MIKKINKSIVDYFDRVLYPNHKKQWDNKIFREFTLEYVDKDTVLLDAGAGRGYLKEMNFKDHVKKAVGVDPDKIVKTNPYLHEAHIGLADNMHYFKDESFDVIVSNNVLEHISDPNAFYAETSRVLKKGGVLITKTPNMFHYMPVIAMITPQSFHNFASKLRGTPAGDTFPTQYKANSKKAQTKFGKENNLKVEKMVFVEGRPEYLRMFFFTYILGMIYERFVNFFKLDQFKIVMFTIMRKV